MLFSSPVVDTDIASREDSWHTVSVLLQVSLCVYGLQKGFDLWPYTLKLSCSSCIAQTGMATASWQSLATDPGMADLELRGVQPVWSWGPLLGQRNQPLGTQHATNCTTSPALPPTAAAGDLWRMAHMAPINASSGSPTPMYEFSSSPSATGFDYILATKSSFSSQTLRSGILKGITMS